MHIHLIGAGVVGLACALRLLRAGHAVRVSARELPPRTTSNVAAAVWYPYAAEPLELVARWGEEAYAWLAAGARAGTLPGCRMTPAREFFRATAAEPPWARYAEGFRRLSAPELAGAPGGPWADGFAWDTPVAETGPLLEWLLAEVRAAGGLVAERAIPSLAAAAAEDADAVVNCAGLGARELADDPELFPIRGQVVRIARNPAEPWIYLTATRDEPRPIYLIPRGEDIILGGISERGEWSREIDPAVAADILARCAALDPRVRDAVVLGHAAGLRPGRSAIRLEEGAPLRAADGRAVRLIHCYGHGGSGVTLAWGCAGEVAGKLRG